MIALLFALSAHLWADSYTAFLHDVGGGKDTPWLFRLRHEELSTQKEMNTFFDSEEKAALVEEVEFSEPGQFVRFSVAQNQLGEKGVIEVRDNKVFFSYEKEGRTKKSEEKWVSNLVIGPTLVFYIKKNWKKLSGGEEIKIRYGVVDRRETVGFTLKITDETLRGRQSFKTVKMSPSSWLISKLVAPIHLTFEDNPLRLRNIVGRMPPKTKVGGKWKDSDYRVFYEYDWEMRVKSQ